MADLPVSRIVATKGCLALIVGAGLIGAAGVALAAVAAHKIDSPALVTASSMLIIHAAAVVAIATVAAALPGYGFVTAGTVMLAAVSLFSGDVALHVTTGSHLFPFAAPTGGSLTILSWLAVAGCAIAAFIRNPR
ncbi:MAG: DUF423 domain-containing protein [Hyphomicrobium sp.]